jgi:peptide/nickel transport system substrate-binding protein
MSFVAVAMRAAVLFAACACAASSAPAAARADTTTLRIGMTTDPNSLSPLFALNDYEQAVDRLIFDVLVSVGADGRTLIPRLAQTVPTLANGGISDGGRTITYHLRRNVRWHDGVPFTSKDVSFSVAAIMNPANNVPNRHGYDQIAKVETPDAYTVVFRMKRVFAPAITTLFGDGTPGAILPEHLLGRLPDLNRVDFNEHPIGTGPYALLRWQRGASIELAANAAYYSGRPKIDRISIRIVPDDTTAVNQLRSHELDAFIEATLTSYAQMRSIPGVRVALSDLHGAANVVLNTTRPDLQDVRVRRAIAAAIDKAALVRDATFGAATVATQDLPSFMWAYDPLARGESYNPAEARALLAAAGWRPGPDGVVVRGGRRLSLTFAYAQNNATARIAAVTIQSYLRAVGIDTQLKGYNSAIMFAPYAAGGVYQSGNFDLAWYVMTLGIDPDAFSRFTSGAIPPNGQNYSRYRSHQMDAAQAAGLATFDRNARKLAYARSQDLLARDVPVVFVWWPKNVAAYDARLRGFAPNPITPTWNAQDWSY